MIGPTLGGLLLSHFWWGSVFLINIPLVALALAGVLLTVPETAEPGGHRLDFTGTLLIAGALFAPRGRHHRGTHPGLDRRRSPWPRGPRRLAGLGLFVWWELRAPQPADRPAGVRGPRLLGRGRRR